MYTVNEKFKIACQLVFFLYYPKARVLDIPNNTQLTRT